jgi:hypothetical protein
VLVFAQGNSTPLTIYQKKHTRINKQLAKSLRIVKELNSIRYHMSFTSHGDYD